MYFVDRLGPLPHEIVRTEMRGPPGHNYKVLCMRPVEPTGATCQALGRSSTDATSVAPEAFVQKNELVYLRERFGQLWCLAARPARPVALYHTRSPRASKRLCRSSTSFASEKTRYDRKTLIRRQWQRRHSRQPSRHASSRLSDARIEEGA